jgi:hypothetical protein
MARADLRAGFCVQGNPLIKMEIIVRLLILSPLNSSWEIVSNPYTKRSVDRGGDRVIQRER